MSEWGIILYYRRFTIVCVFNFRTMFQELLLGEDLCATEKSLFITGILTLFVSPTLKMVIARSIAR